MLVIRHLFDPVADTLAGALGPRLRSLTIETWLAGCTFTHSVGQGGVASEVRARGGPVLLDGATAIVLNRVRHVPVPAFHRSSQPDREYASAEATAAFWSCLEGLDCPVLNDMARLHMAGHGRPGLAAAGHAARAGLRTRVLRMSTRSRLGEPGTLEPVGNAGGPVPAVGAPVFACQPADGERGMLWVVGNAVVGELQGVGHAAVLAFARSTGLGFGVVQFVRGPDGDWLWSGFDAAPMAAPAAVIGALRQHMERQPAPGAEGAVA
ncbi:hypothetical protein [Pseudoduganella lutea]|uniref:Uncharacterized protein n=1 Tax=Pseudoduganella lutea TaxID=321985 RepID=A0A4P6KUI0_9BURK|nr:hypothetical protein [Pseudoduganella lutea]QBE62580.1 hypothetical protein EWM63_06005 [Pseudoduganella lutea]